MPKFRNKFLKSSNTSKPLTHLLYLDADILYGHSMMELLSIDIFYWVNPKIFYLDSYLDDSPIGFFIEVNLYYPDKYHDLYNDYPFTPEKMKFAKNFCLNINCKSQKRMNILLVKMKNLFLIWAVKKQTLL